MGIVTCQHGRKSDHRLFSNQADGMPIVMNNHESVWIFDICFVVFSTLACFPDDTM